MRWAVVLVATSACWSESRTPTAPPAQPPQATPSRIDDGREYAIVEVVRRVNECSGLGGSHFVLKTLDRNPPQIVHAGGHGKHPQLRVGDIHVAELRVDVKPDANPGWCLDELPQFDASASRVIHVGDLGVAKKTIAQVKRSGMAQSIAMRAFEGPEQISIGRVVDVSGFTVRLEPIDGDVPAWIELPFHAKDIPLIGDPLVIATQHAKPTRLLVAETVAHAKQWATMIRTDGWPLEPLVLDDIATRRWTAFGTVTSNKCGHTIEASGPLEETKSEAPDGLTAGDTVIAVVTARFTPDRCGRVSRVIRVYPAGTMTAQNVQVRGIPRGVRPLAD